MGVVVVQIIMEKGMAEGTNTTILTMGKKDTRDSTGTTLKVAIIKETKDTTTGQIKRDTTKVLGELPKGTNKVASIMVANIMEVKEPNMRDMVTKGIIKRVIQPKDFTTLITRYFFCLPLA